MSYAIITNDIVDVDKLVSQVKQYSKAFERHEDDFIHHKTEERFELNLEKHVPHLCHDLSQIYDSGRSIAMSVYDAINKYLDYASFPLLKTAIDHLEPCLLDLKQYGLDERERINEIYIQCGYNEWSINQMLAQIPLMCRQIDEILSLTSLIKTSHTYQVQSGNMTTQEASDRSKPTMTATHFSGDFSQSIISTGNHSTNALTISASKEISDICQELIKLINNVDALDADKEAVSATVEAIQLAEGQPSLKKAYQNFMTSISNHVTVGSAILNSGILPALNLAIM